MLNSHPDIFLGPFKELQFFNSIYVPQHRKWTRWHVRTSVERCIRDHLSKKGQKDFSYLRRLCGLADDASLFTEEWYRLAFSAERASGKCKGDITPEYSSLPEYGVNYVRRLLGDVPVIYLVRDPLSRSLSQMRMEIARHHRNDEAVDWDSLINSWDIHDRGDYEGNMTRWLARYPREKMLFVPYRDIATDPIGVLRRVEAHIGVSAADYPNADEPAFVGPKLDIPPDVKEKMATRLSPQYDFLRRMFGDDFCNRI